MIDRIDNILKSKSLTGRKAVEEVSILEQHFAPTVCPKSFLEILPRYDIIGQRISLTEEEDLSKFGVEMQWLTPQEQVAEAYEFYPGIVAVVEGFLPIGKCLEGSGDPYFLKIEDNKWNIYRIPHDAVVEECLELTEVDFVCSLIDLLILS